MPVISWQRTLKKQQLYKIFRGSNRYSYCHDEVSWLPTMAPDEDPRATYKPGAG